MAITVKDIAAELQLSVPTVVQVLGHRGRISAKTRARVLETAGRLGYRPHAAARAIREGRTQHIGVVIHALGLSGVGDHAYDTVSGINSVLEPLGYTTCLVQMFDVEKGARGLSRVFREQALDGMIVHAGVLDRARQWLDELVDRVIWCDAGVHEPVNCLWRHEERAGALAAQAAFNAGHRHVILVCQKQNEPRPYSHRQRRETGFRQKAEELGLPVEIVEVDEDHRSGWEQVLPRLLTPGTCVIANGYTQTEMIAHAATSAGLCLGRDLSLASCDDRAWYAHRWPQLSRATFNRFAMGQQAARMMLQRLSNPDEPCPSYIDQPEWLAGSSLVPASHLPKEV